MDINIKPFQDELKLLKGYLFYKIDNSLKKKKKLKSFEEFKEDHLKAKQDQISRNIAEKSRKRCYYCNCRLNHLTVTVDHIIPRSRGGNSTEFNKLDCCAKHNQLKANYYPTGFLKKLLWMVKTGNYGDNTRRELKGMIARTKILITEKRPIISKMATYNKI